MTSAGSGSFGSAQEREVIALKRIRALLQVVVPIGEKVANHGYAIEPTSALQLDHERLPTLGVGVSVDRSLRHSFHHLWGLDRLLQLGDIPQYVPYTLVRCAIESAATAVWLLDEDGTTRLQRRVALELDDVKQTESAVGAAGADHQGGDERSRALENALVDAGLAKQQCAWRGYTRVIREVDRNKGTTKSLELAWRACSGMAHGMFWAVQMMAPPTNVIALDSNTMRATFTPNFHTLAIVLDKAVDTLQRADSLYDTRRR